MAVIEMRGLGLEKGQRHVPPKSVGRGRACGGADGVCVTTEGRADEMMLLQRWIGTFESQFNAAGRCVKSFAKAWPGRGSVAGSLDVALNMCCSCSGTGASVRRYYVRSNRLDECEW